MPAYFDHEKLKVYQKAIEFVVFTDRIISSVSAKVAVKDQLDRAATSIPLNIAEGNGKTSVKDRCRFFEIARGSAFECAACLDVLVAKDLLQDNDVIQGKDILFEIVRMIFGMIRSLSEQVKEDEGEYVIE